MPWGSYGMVLWQGKYIYDRDSDMHLVFRTGPFCPSIYRTEYNSACPVLIVKKDVLHHLTESGLTGFVPKPVSKEKIVRLAWEKWDLSAPEPQIYPSGDMDAENYIIRRKHDEQTSNEIGDLFALVPQKDAFVYFNGGRTTAQLVSQSVSGLDIFVDRLHYDSCSELYVSCRAKDILYERYSDLLSFQPIPMFESDEDLLSQLEERANIIELKSLRNIEMTNSDWIMWHRLRDEARTLIEGLNSLKTQSAKSKRSIKIGEKLKSANELYPLDYENWMMEYWPKNI